MAPSGPSRRARSLAVRLAIVLGVAWLALGVAGPVAPVRASGVGAASAASTMVTLTATNQLSFVPATITVTTASVEIEIENVATTDHTFTLSSRVNQTAPASTNASATAPGSYFDAADVLADSVVAQGRTVFVNVTLPALGTYEFVCRYHFPSMVGTLTYSASAPASSSGVPWLLYGLVGGLVVIIIVVVAVLAMRRRPPAPSSPPPAS